ncbi:MAG: hypothetical protein ACMG6E_02610 [Candidatus Roizmanbacteria bacterium]
MIQWGKYMEDESSIESVRAQMRDFARNQELFSRIIPFGKISGLSENARLQPKIETPLFRSGLSILLQLGLIPLKEDIGTQSFFVEHYHPYIYSMEGPPEPRYTSRGIDEETEARAFAGFMADFIKACGATPRGLLFVDDAHIDPKIQRTEFYDRTEMPDGTVVMTHVKNGVVLGSTIDLRGGTYDEAISEVALIPQARVLMAEIIGKAQQREGMRIKGDRRKKVVLENGTEIYLTDKDGTTPTCEVLEAAYRIELVQRESPLLSNTPYSGGIILLPVSFRAQQERVTSLLDILGIHDNVVTVLLD